MVLKKRKKEDGNNDAADARLMPQITISLHVSRCDGNSDDGKRRREILMVVVKLSFYREDVIVVKFSLGEMGIVAFYNTGFLVI